MKHISAKHYIRGGKLWRVNEALHIDRPWNGLTDNELIEKCLEALIEATRLQREMAKEKRWRR